VTYKAVIFDLDGTLLDTLEDLGNCCNRVLARLGLPEHKLDSYRYFVGDGREKLVERVLPQDRRDPDSIRQVVASFDAEYDLHWADRTRPFNGIDELLGELSRRSIPFAVVSNKPDRFTRLCVSKLLHHHSFRAVLGARPDVPTKPDPASALEAAEIIGVEPRQCVYLGDTDIDMETAVRAGMLPVGALWGFRAASELESAGAKALISSPIDLVTLLDKAG